MLSKIKFGLVAPKATIEDKFGMSFPNTMEYKPNYNICTGQTTLVIASNLPHNYQFIGYGMIPFWSKEQNVYYQAPAEGTIQDYTPGKPLKKNIILHPAFRKSIREQRCLIPADYFMVSNKDGFPYVVYLKGNTRPFALGGLWDFWKENILGESYQGFALISMPANDLLQSVGITRMPFIVPEHGYKKWVKNGTDLSDITAMLKAYPDKHLNAYPVNPEIMVSVQNQKKLIMPFGDKVQTEELPDFSSEVQKMKRYWQF